MSVIPHETAKEERARARAEVKARTKNRNAKTVHPKTAKTGNAKRVITDGGHRN